MADNVIDSLSIQIDSDIKGASKGIEELKKTLNSLNDIYNKAKEASGNVHEKLRDLASGMNAIANINSDGLKSATAAMRGFLKLDFGSMSAIPAGVADNIVSIADGVNLFAMQIDGKELNKAMSALKKLREFDFQGLSMNVDNLDPSIAQKVRTFMDSFKSVSGDFTVSDTLASMQSLFQIDFSGFANFMEEASKGMPNFSAAIQQFAAACATPEFDSAIEKLQRLANVDLSGLAQLAVSGKKLVPDVSKQVDSETAEVKSSVEKMKSVLDLSGIFKRAVGGVKMVAAIPFNSLKKGFASVRASAEKAANKVTGFVRSFGRIAFYRSIRFLFSQIAKGFKEGTDNLYQYSKAIDGKFAKSMDMISTSMLYFRNSVAAAAAPIINYLAPALDVLVDKAVEVLNWFNELTAKLTGASTWTKALKYPKEYAEATKDASKALKDFQMGFDELNVISDNSSSSAADALDYSKMFTEMPTDMEVDPWLENFKKAIEESDFYGAGAILGEKFNHLFDGIDFEGLGKSLGEKINNAIYFANGFLDYSDFKQVGEHIAEFLNGSIKEIDFYSVGHMLGMGINKIFDVANGFITKFDWKTFGLKMADAFNGLVDFIDFDNIISTLQNGLLGVLTSLNSFLENAHFFDLGHKIGTALNQINIPEILGMLTRTFFNLLSSVANLLSGIIQGYSWVGLGNQIVDGIFGFFSGDGDTSWATKWCKSIWELFGSALGATVGLLWGVVSRVAEKVRNFFVNWWDENKDKTLDEIWEGFKEGILNSFSNIVNFVKENIFEPFMNGFTSAFGIHSPSTVMMKQGSYIIEGLKDGITNAWSGIKTWIRVNIFDKFITGFKELFGINSPSTEMIKLGNFITEGLKNGITGKWNELTSAVSEKLDDLKSIFSDFSIDSFVTKITDKVVEMKNSIADTIGNIPAAIRGKANGIWEAVEQLINGMIEGFNHFADNISEKFSFTIPNIPGVAGAGQSFGLTIPHIPPVSLGRFENGGFPNIGELFLANENGVAEMIGRIGNRTAVANNDQIVEAVAQGVAQAVAEVLGNRSDNSNQNINIYLDGKQITASVEKYQRTRGVSIYGGGFVNA